MQQNAEVACVYHILGVGPPHISISLYVLQFHLLVEKSSSGLEHSDNVDDAGEKLTPGELLWQIQLNLPKVRYWELCAIIYQNILVNIY